MTAEQQVRLDQIVWADPGRLSGTPCFRGTRVPAQTLIDHIEGNATLEQFLTIDRRIEQQVDLRTFALGFVIVRVTSNTFAAYTPSFERLLGAVESVRKGEVIHLAARPNR